MAVMKLIIALLIMFAPGFVLLAFVIYHGMFDR